MEWIWSQNYYSVYLLSQYIADIIPPNVPSVYLLSQYIADIIPPNVPRFEVKAHLHVKNNKMNICTYCIHQM